MVAQVRQILEHLLDEAMLVFHEAHDDGPDALAERIRDFEFQALDPVISNYFFGQSPELAAVAATNPAATNTIQLFGAIAPNPGALHVGLGLNGGATLGDLWRSIHHRPPLIRLGLLIQELADRVIPHLQAGGHYLHWLRYVHMIILTTPPPPSPPPPA